MERAELNVEEFLIKLDCQLSGIELKDSSLFFGKSGLVLFYAALYKIFPDPVYFRKCEKLKNEVIGAIHSVRIDRGLTQGLAGVTWALDFLNRSGLHDAANNKIDLDSSLYVGSLRSLMNGDMNYFDGSLSCVKYAIHRLPDEKALGYLHQYISVIKNKFTKNINLSSLDYISNPQGRKGVKQDSVQSIVMLCNLLNILIDAFKKDIMSSDIESIMCKSLNSLMSFSQTEFNYYNPRPVPKSLVLRSGILSVAWTFWKAGDAFGNQHWKIHALKVARVCINISPTIDPQKLDASLLKGSLGICQLFNRFYQKTRADEFKSQSLYWKRITFGKILESQKFIENQPLSKKARQRQVAALLCLNVTVGFGLTLLSEHDDKIQNWNECLLL